MEAAALQRANRALDRAGRCLEKLIATSDLDEAEEIWSDFLASINRIYVMLEAGAGKNTAASNWLGGVTHERRTDKLLTYIHHARNSHEHRLEEIVNPEQGYLNIGFGKTGFKVQQYPAGLNVVDVIDRGKLYRAPTSHLDKMLPDQRVITVGKHALNYAKKLVWVAENFQ